MSSSPSSTARSYLVLLGGGLVLVILAWLIFEPIAADQSVSMELGRARNRNLVITPAAPATFSELHVTGLPPDAARASLASTPAPVPGRREYRVIWSVNGQDVATGPRLAADAHRRGDLVEARLERLTAEGALLKEIGRASTTIVNAEPVIRSVTLRRSPERPSQVEAIVDVADPDGDIVELDYRWLVAGKEHERAEKEIAFVDGVGSGSGIALHVTASDLSGGQTSYTTAELELSNQPPNLDFGKSAHLRQDNDGQRWAALDVRASDPDGDPIEVTLVDPPAGFVFDASENWVRWSLDDGTVPYDVTVRVSDGRGGSAERTVTVKR